MPTYIQTPAQTVSTRFSADTLARLDAVSSIQQRFRSDIIKDALDGYLDATVWLGEQVARGLDDLRHGRRISHEDLREKYKKLGVDVD